MPRGLERRKEPRMDCLAGGDSLLIDNGSIAML